MKKLNKRVDTKNTVVVYNNSKGYNNDIKRVTFAITNEEKNRVIKRINFNMSEGFSFDAFVGYKDYEDLKNIEQMDILINEANPLYVPLSNLLKGDDYIIIDDDETKEIEQKTMTVARQGESIKVLFTNKVEHQHGGNPLDKFEVCIRNTQYDGKSKLDYDFDKKLYALSQKTGLTIDDLYKYGMAQSVDYKRKLRNLFDDFEVALAPKEKLEDILMPENKKFDKEELDKNKRALFAIIPELIEEDGFNQKNPWHIYDVWEHTEYALENSEEDLEIRLALLLHDIGKPHSYQDNGQKRHFKGHAKKSVNITKNVLRRLGYEEKEIKRICYLVENHSTLINIQNVNSNNLEITKKLLQVQYCDTKAYNPQYAEKVIKKLNATKEELAEKEKQIIATKVISSLNTDDREER